MPVGVSVCVNPTQQDISPQREPHFGLEGPNHECRVTLFPTLKLFHSQGKSDMGFRFTLLTAALAAFAIAPGLHADDWPEPVRSLVAEGLEIHGEFQAPGGLKGYAASHQGREMTVFVTADGEHAIVGTSA